MWGLEDAFGRRFSYLRLSITDACNFRCVYCLPQGYERKKDFEDYLSLIEIKNLVLAFVELGMWKIRLTGGEPTLRRDLCQIVKMISSLSEVRTIALSTNGYRLKALAKELVDSGLNAINVSVDSLNPDEFSKITGQNLLPEVLEGIEKALQVGIPRVKVNAVLLKGWNEESLESFSEWIRDRPISVRFIELMPTHQNRALFDRHHLRGSQIQEKWIARGWVPEIRKESDGPAQEFSHPNYRGKLGLITPYSKDFCSTCNRLRVTSHGGLRLCLFGEGNSSLRHLLQKESQRQELKEKICSLLVKKEISHGLPVGRYGNTPTFSAIGG